MPNKTLGANQPTRHCWAQHDTLPWVIVVEHESNATSSSDFPKQTTYGSSTNCPKAKARDQSSLPSLSTLWKSSSDFQTQAHASPLAVVTPSGAPSFHGQESRRVSSLRSHVPDATAPTSGCKTRHHVSTRCREAKCNRQRRHQSHDRNPNATPSGRERRRWRHRHRVFTLGWKS